MHQLTFQTSITSNQKRKVTGKIILFLKLCIVLIMQKCNAKKNRQNLTRLYYFFYFN